MLSSSKKYLRLLLAGAALGLFIQPHLAHAEFSFKGCPLWDTGGFVDSSPGGAIKQALEPGIPLACRPIVVGNCTFSSGTTTAQYTCPWQSSDQTKSQCVALGINNSAGSAGTGMGLGTDSNGVSHCAIAIGAPYSDDQKQNGPCCGESGDGPSSFGNPINVANANKFQVEKDFVDPNGLLSFTRIYNSKAGGVRLVIRTLPIGANMAQEVWHGEASSLGGVQA